MQYIEGKEKTNLCARIAVLKTFYMDNLANSSCKDSCEKIKGDINRIKKLLKYLNRRKLLTRREYPFPAYKYDAICFHLDKLQGISPNQANGLYALPDNFVDKLISISKS